METKITPERLKELLLLICDRETSQDPGNWTPDNPLYGHCAVVALVAQDLFGGELLRASLAEVPEFAHMRSHYWNRLADGSIEDFTKPQFGDHYPVGLKAEIKDRAHVLSYPETAKRHKLLSLRLVKVLSNNNARKKKIRRKPDWNKLRKELAKAGQKRAKRMQAVNILHHYSVEEILFDRLLCAFEKFFQYTENTLKKIEAARKIDRLMMDIERIESKKTTDKRKKKKEDLLYENFLTALKAFHVYVENGLRRKKDAKKISMVKKRVASIYHREIKAK